MVQGPIQQRFVDNQVVEALIRNRLPYDSPLREKLNSDAEIIGRRGEGFLRMRNIRRELVSVDDRMKELKADPDFHAFFPDPPKIGSSDDRSRRTLTGSRAARSTL